ncbi:MAG: class I SAM-dependent RNA methyltransferase [Gemmatimonadaceae bacterium]
MPARRNPSRSATRSSAATRLKAFAAAAPGLEPLVATELRALDIVPNVDAGGVSFQGGLETVARANLWLRTASRVIVRVASFRAQAFYELERLARAVPWEHFLRTDAAVRFRVTSKKSRLYHTGAIEQRLGEALRHRLGRSIVVEAAAEIEDEEDAATPAQLFVVRAFHDEFTISADSSGALLHLRGYRQAVAKAPMRETLAAAMLLASEWDGSTPLLDPMCGSGTIPIEAALIARRIAPGRRRSFAFQEWPSFDVAMWEQLRAEAESRALPRSPVSIKGSDRDAGAIEAARANAERAGVSADIELSLRALSAIEDCATETGQIVTNPPYGVRVGEADRLRDLYARLGQVVRSKCPGWGLTVLSANQRLERELRLRLENRLSTRNGGIPVRVLKTPRASAKRVRSS